MYATTRTWHVIYNGVTKEKVWLAPGCYELERIFNPFGFIAPWLVLRGTKIGQTEDAWRQWEGTDIEITIEE